MKIIYKLALLLLINTPFLSSCSASAHPSAEEYRIYQRLLLSYQTSGYERFVILNTTYPTSAGLQSASLFAELSAKMPGLQEETVHDFIEANASPSTLKNSFENEDLIHVLSASELAEQAGDPTNWDIYNQVFPVSPGIISLTRAGFNHDATQALVYYTITGSNDTETSYFLFFAQSEEKWTIVESIQTALQ